MTADVVASALSSANAFLNVTVEEDDPPFDGARRFVVDFHAPKVGVGVLGVVSVDDYDDDGDCEWFQCLSDEDDDEDDDEDGDCEDSGVLVNRDVSVFVEEGAVEVRIIWGCLLCSITIVCLLSRNDQVYARGAEGVYPCYA